MKIALLISFLTLTSCCQNREYNCGEMVPVTFGKLGTNTSLNGNTCKRGFWKPIPTGPWYVCECK